MSETNGDTPADKYALTRNKRRFIGGKKGYKIGYIIRFPHPFQRDAGKGIFVLRFDTGLLLVFLIGDAAAEEPPK